MSGRNRKGGLPSGLSLGIELLILAIGLGVLAYSRGSFLKLEGDSPLFQREESSSKEEVSSEKQQAQEGIIEYQDEEPMEAKDDKAQEKSAQDAEFEPVPTPRMDPVKVQDASEWLVAAPVSEGEDGSKMVPIDDSWEVATPLEQGMVGESTGEQADEAGQAAQSGSLKDASILVVNGTYKNGVASYWEGRLKEEGYTSLVTGNNNSSAQAETVIYTSDPSRAAELAALFPGAQVVEEQIPATVTLGDGSALSQAYDVCIVVGTKDAESL